MPEALTGSPGSVTREVAAEAAVWIARLHGPDRSPEMEREFRAWQAKSRAHREAFERCTEVWIDVPRVTVANAFASANADARSSRTHVWRWSAAGATAALVACVAVLLWKQVDGRYETGRGEQQRVVLDDGTRVTLNTDTRATVALSSGERRVTLVHGEALFEVAKDPARPFVVRAGGADVVAVGTVFSVRYTPEVASEAGLEVTLVEGKVAVRDALPAAVDRAASSASRVMTAGDRLRWPRLTGSALAVAQLDRPKLEAVTAWQRNETVFDDVSLVDAVAEMNRYGRTPIVLIGDFREDSLRVSGLYRTGESLGFARAVATLHGLTLHETPGRLELGKPQAGNR